ncbi:MAG TPA: helix-turn-helix transcriptional regulator [Novosphingobium sp.]|nr:helix-turn-helix transcriptional regulator [Novosphingobium sp.]
MAISAHFEELSQPADTAREPRRKLLLEARGATASGEAGVLVHNISATGLLLESAAALAADDPIEIELPQAGATSAKVVWTSGRLAGCQFDAPISAAALSAAQLRSAATPGIELAGAVPDEAFAAQLQRLRRERGLTLAQVAAQLGVSKPTVWAWERGKAHPVESRLDALAAALGVTREALLPARAAPALRALLAQCREQIASAVGTLPANVRIMIEL